MGGRFPYCNSLLVDSGPRAVIDPGSSKMELRALGREGVGLCLLTHSHSDHLRNLRELAGAETWVHESERAAVESFAGMAELVWFPEETRDETWIRRKNREVGGWGWPVAGTFQDQAEIKIGAVTAIALHAPGHTPGHTCFWFPDHKLLCSADLDLTDFGPWYGNAGSDVAAFVSTIARIKELRPELTVTGHEMGVIQGDITDRLTAFERVIFARHERILAYLAAPRPLDDIVAQAFIYGEFYSPTNSYHPPETRMIRHHLAWAEARGEVRREGKLYRRLEG